MNRSWGMNLPDPSKRIVPPPPEQLHLPGLRPILSPDTMKNVGVKRDQVVKEKYGLQIPED